MFQLYLPAIGRNVSKLEFNVSGILTPQRWVSEDCWNDFKKTIPQNPIIAKKEFESFASQLGHLSYNDNGEFIPNTGKLTLLPTTLEEFFPENFFPENWFYKSHRVSGGSGRRIYSFDAVKLDGSKEKIFVKAPKEAYGISTRDNGSFNVHHLQAIKKSKDELQTLVNLEKAGVNVSQPLAMFEQGHEQYVFVKNVEGVNPLKLLSDKMRRDEFWKADATLLAKIFKAGYKHWGFFSSKFDDKIWSNGKLFLIDTDETNDVKNYYPVGDYFEKNPHKLPQYFKTGLQDCLYEYVSFGVMEKDERMFYAIRFLEEMNYSTKQAQKLIFQIDRCNSHNSGNWTTEESYVSLCADCD